MDIRIIPAYGIIRIAARSRKFRNDPEERIRKQEQIEERKSHDRAVKAVLGAKHRDVFKIEDI